MLWDIFLIIKTNFLPKNRKNILGTFLKIFDIAICLCWAGNQAFVSASLGCHQQDLSFFCRRLVLMHQNKMLGCTQTPTPHLFQWESPTDARDAYTGIYPECLKNVLSWGGFQEETVMFARPKRSTRTIQYSTRLLLWKVHPYLSHLHVHSSFWALHLYQETTMIKALEQEVGVVTEDLLCPPRLRLHRGGVHHSLSLRL